MYITLTEVLGVKTTSCRWYDKTLYLKINNFQENLEEKKLFFKIMAFMPTFLCLKSVF